MSWQDIVQGCYEALAGLAILGNCVTLYRDKQVRGVSVTTTAFFTSWGYWNLYYFPHLHQWMAFTGGLLVVAANTTWVSMMLYYRRRERARVLWAYGPNGLAGGKDL